MEQVKIGAVTIDALSDGELFFPLAGMFPEAESEAFGRHGGISADGLLGSPMTTFVVRTAGKLILVDTGIGPELRPLARFGYTGTAGQLPRALEEAGIEAAAIDCVVMTHLHTDHIGWNTIADDSGALRPTFPNARYVVTRTDWEHRMTVAGRSNVARCLEPVEASGQLTLAGDGFEVAPGVSLLATPGHTPGHASVLIMGGSEGAIITGDAAHHPAELEAPDMSPHFDSDPVESAASRRALVERAEAEGLVVLGGHFPPPHAGTVVRVGERREWRWLGG